MIYTAGLEINVPILRVTVANLYKVFVKYATVDQVCELRKDSILMSALFGEPMSQTLESLRYF